MAGAQSRTALLGGQDEGWVPWPLGCVLPVVEANQAAPPSGWPLLKAVPGGVPRAVLRVGSAEAVGSLVHRPQPCLEPLRGRLTRRSAPSPHRGRPVGPAAARSRLRCTAAAVRASACAEPTFCPDVSWRVSTPLHRSTRKGVPVMVGLARWCVRHRRSVLLGWVSVFVALGAMVGSVG